MRDCPRPRGRASVPCTHIRRPPSPNRPRSKASKPNSPSAGSARAPTGSTARRPRDRGLRHRHAAAHGERLAARRPRLLLHAHRHHRALQAHARHGGLLSRWAGTTTACRPSAGCRTTTACAAIRRCPTTRRSSRRRQPDKHPIAISRPNFIELCTRLTVEDEQAFENLWRHLGLSIDWSMTYATIAKPAQRVSQLAFLRLLGSATRPTRSKRRRSGTWTSRPPSRRPNSRTARCPAPTTACASRARTACGRAWRRRLDRDRHHAARTAAGLRGAGRASRRRPLSAALRQPRHHAALRRARAGAGASARRPREGQRHRHDLHLRRHHRRHLVARAEAAGAGRDPAQRHARPGDAGAAPGGSRRRRRRRRRPTTS